MAVLYLAEKPLILVTSLNSDLIIVLREGAVVEQGTHEELLCAGGLYTSMWHEQALDGGSSDEIAKLEDELQGLRAEREEAILAGITKPSSGNDGNPEPLQR